MTFLDIIGEASLMYNPPPQYALSRYLPEPPLMVTPISAASLVSPPANVTTGALF